MKKHFLWLLCILVWGVCKAEEKNISGLNSKQFHKYRKVESETPDYKVTFMGDTVEIHSPKGLTL